MSEAGDVVVIEAPRGEKRVERVEDRSAKPEKRKTQVEQALKGMREESEERDQLRNGNILVQAAIADEQDKLPEDSKDYVTPEIARLRTIDAALLEISYQGPNALSPEKMELVASYFRDERDAIDDLTEGTDKATADKNKDIYNRILAEIYGRLPLPEAALGEAPNYEFEDVKAIMKPLQKDSKESSELTLGAAIESFQAIKKDVATVVDGKSKQINIVNQGRGYAQEHMDTVKDAILVGELNEEGKVEYKPYNADEKYEPKIGDNKQFILDINGPYSQQMDAFEQLKECAGDAVTGLEKLQNKKKLSDKEVFSIALLLEKLEEDIGSSDNIHNARIIDDLGKFLKTKLYEAGEIELENEDDEPMDNKKGYALMA